MLTMISVTTILDNIEAIRIIESCKNYLLIFHQYEKILQKSVFFIIYGQIALNFALFPIYLEFNGKNLTVITIL